LEDFGMSKLRSWPVRFGLRGLFLFVLVIAVGLTAFDGWRRVRGARAARAEFEPVRAGWEEGVITSDEVIAASQNVFQAEQRQWFSSAYERAIVDSHILRLCRLRDRMRYAAEHFLHDSEEGRQAALQRVDEVSQMIEELEDFGRAFRTE
jgi:hypothetical protein